jgi:hypothetical protein
MDLVDSIERGRFVGREFLVWMWFESEVLEGTLETRAQGSFELWPEAQITLVAEKEQSRLKGAIPSAQPEAREALRQGKLPTHARLRLIKDGLEYTLQFAADGLTLSSVRIPATLKQEGDEQFEERMDLVEKLDALFGSLYSDFLVLRLGAAWDAHVAPAIRAWIRDDESLDVDAYTRAKKDALGKKKKGADAPPNLSALARMVVNPPKGPMPEEEPAPPPRPRAKPAPPPRAVPKAPKPAPKKGGKPKPKGKR